MVLALSGPEGFIKIPSENELLIMPHQVIDPGTHLCGVTSLHLRNGPAFDAGHGETLLLCEYCSPMLQGSAKKLQAKTSLSLVAGPVAGLFYKGQQVGLLGMELHSRRRNRVNCVIEHAEGQALRLKVGHSFGNCPKYIQVQLAALP